MKVYFLLLVKTAVGNFTENQLTKYLIYSRIIILIIL